MDERLSVLVGLGENGEMAPEHNIERQKRVKHLHDKKSSDRNFDIGDWLLKWNVIDQDKGKHGKFDALLLGPFVISKQVGENTFFLQDTNGNV